MKLNKFTRAAVILLILAFNIGCDQYSKTVVRHNMGGFNKFEYLGGHFTLERAENSGAFLSLGDSLSGPVRYILLNILPLLAVLFGLYYIFTRTNLNRVTLIAIILIIGGGLGNLYDRVRYGSVTDFMHIKFGFLETGIFNVADMSIMAGTIMIILHAWFKKKPEEEVETAPTKQ
jgi:signal peptidase II